MANSYLKTAFAIIVAAAEAELVLAAQTTAHALYDDEIDETSARVAHFQSLGDAFARAFPPTGDDPFSGFLALFDDADYPSFGGDFEISPFQNDPERRELYFGGEQVELDAVARLLRLRRRCRSGSSMRSIVIACDPTGSAGAMSRSRPRA